MFVARSILLFYILRAALRPLSVAYKKTLELLLAGRLFERLKIFTMRVLCRGGLSGKQMPTMSDMDIENMQAMLDPG